MNTVTIARTVPDRQLRSAKPIRVLHVIKGLGQGGAEHLLTEIQRCHDRAAFTHAFAFFDAGASDLAGQFGDAQVICFDRSSVLRILLAPRIVAQFAKSWKTDVIHCHLPISGVAGRVAGRMAGIPVVYTEHNVLEAYHSFSRALDVATWHWQDHVIAVSAAVRASIAHAAPASVPVTTVLNGIDTELFSPAAYSANARQCLGIGAAASVVGTVASFRTEKNLTAWIETAVRIAALCPETHFILVGDGPTRSEVMARASWAGLNERVHFTGRQRDVRHFLNAMDVFLMTSAFEGMPLALAEAMAMERAIVAPAVGGIPELVANGMNGLLVKHAGTNALAAAVVLLLRSPCMRRTLGEAARQTVVARLRSESMVSRLERVYTTVAQPAVA